MQQFNISEHVHYLHTGHVPGQGAGAEELPGKACGTFALSALGSML